MAVSYSPSLIVASIIIAMFGSVAALSASGRIRAHGRIRRRWLVLSAICLGCSIWSMHFIAMLAFHAHDLLQDLTISYDVPLTLFSLVLPMAGAVVGFWLAHGASRPRWIVAGLIFGLAIVAMHYVGMWAMVMPARQVYSPTLVALSYVIAAGAAMAALRISRVELGLTTLLGAGTVMGIAISGMHYTGMWALTLVPDPTINTSTGMAFDREMLGVAVAAATMLFVGGTLVAATYDSLRKSGRNQ